METALEAPRAGEILQVLVGVGDQVQARAPLVVLAPREPA